MKLCSLIFILIAAFITKPMSSTVMNWSDIKPGAGGSRQFLRGSTNVFSSFDVSGETLAAGSKVTPYALKGEEELIIIKEGELVITIGSNTEELGPGSIAYILTGEMHSYANAGNTPTSFYRLRFRATSPVDARGVQAGPSFTRDWEQVEKKTTDKGFLRQFFNRPTAMCTKFEMHVTTLNAGLSSHAPHTHPEEEIILMLRGKAEMEIDGKRHPITPGSLSYVATKVPHALHNIGGGEAEYFAFQWK
jgi:(S)-ureidoglycine aminohydrolase